MSIRRVPCPACGAIPFMMLRGTDRCRDIHRGGWQGSGATAARLGSYVTFTDAVPCISDSPAGNPNRTAMSFATSAAERSVLSIIMCDSR